MASTRKTKASSPQPATPTIARMSTIEARVGVHARLTIAADDVAEVERLAYCPTREHSVGLPVCETCPQFLALTDAHDGQAVVCVPEVDAMRRDRERLLSRLDLQDVALRVPVGEAMTRFVVCVNPDTSLDAVRAILVDTDAACAPVVSRDGLLVGIVSHQSLLGAGDARAAGEAMIAAVLGVPESTPLAHAMATMAQAGILALPVLDGEGSVVGVIGALEALRFIVRRWGYETPSS